MEEKDVIIVGAGPAGLLAAIFTQLDGWSTLVYCFENGLTSWALGGNISHYEPSSKSIASYS